MKRVIGIAGFATAMTLGCSLGAAARAQAQTAPAQAQSRATATPSANAPPPRATTPPAQGTVRPASSAATSAPAPAGGDLSIERYLAERATIFTGMDAIRDGQVTLEELVAYEQKMEDQRRIAQFQQRFVQLDTDRDGKLSGAEFMKMATPRAIADQKPVLSLFDSNRDNRISKSEYLMRMTTIFDRMDRNKNGTIDSSEIAAASASPPAGR